ncbi:MAG: LysE family translocator [Chthoniobacterales bacterium]
MHSTLSGATILSGLVLGWSVAWPPGPVNAEVIRRGILPRAEGGGFWAAYKVGLGACLGDFLWALGVSAGAGAIINTPAIRVSLGVVSLLLLLFLAFNFARGAWRMAREHRTVRAPASMKRKTSRTFLLGLMFTLSSPWNIGFWLAVIGSQTGALTGTFLQSVVLAVAVVLGALTWGTVLCVAVKLGAHIFARPAWQIATQVFTAVVMLLFAARLVWQLAGS